MFKSWFKSDKQVEREYLLREASAARLKAIILMTLEMIVITASREKLIEAWLEMARPNHPELTDKRILEIFENTVPHTLGDGAHI